MIITRCRNCRDFVRLKYKGDYDSCTCFSETGIKIALYEPKYEKDEFGRDTNELTQEYEDFVDDISRGYCLDAGSQDVSAFGTLKDIEVIHWRPLRKKGK